jgi:hypothetical protein
MNAVQRAFCMFDSLYSSNKNIQQASVPFKAPQQIFTLGTAPNNNWTEHLKCLFLSPLLASGVLPESVTRRAAVDSLS